MNDDQRLAVLGQFTPESHLTPGYGNHYLFFVGRDDVHSILLYLISREKLEFDFNQFGYDDEEINNAIINLIKNPSVLVQGTLDKSQSTGAHEKKILTLDETQDPNFFNSVTIGESATHQISHTKGGILVSQGLFFEGSTNWSSSGEGTGIDVKDLAQTKGWKAQNNTLLVSSSPINLLRFKARLLAEHRTALSQQHNVPAQLLHQASSR